MKYTRNAVYSRIEDAVLAVLPEAECTSRRQPYPDGYPAVWAYELDRFTSPEGVTLAFDDDQWTSTFEVQIFSNKLSGAQEEAYAILNAIRAEMKTLYYREVNAGPVENGDPSIYRLVARYRRQIGGGDEIGTES